jgi:hypothetical protein
MVKEEQDEGAKICIFKNKDGQTWQKVVRRLSVPLFLVL